jgi:uncharacterized protein with HEPN domain
MSPAKQPEIRLQHILREIDGVASSIAGRSFEDVFGEYVLERAIERAIEIVSEAAKALPGDLCDRHKAVEWRAIISIGNRLRHEYYRLSQAQLWEIATVHLPALRPVVLSMLDDLSG